MNNCGKNIIFFDGNCIFCRKSANFIFRRDSKKNFYFSSLSSDLFKQIARKYPELNDIDRLILIYKGKIYTGWCAVRTIFLQLNGLTKIAGYFMLIIPEKTGNSIYDFLAKHRKRIWKDTQRTCNIEIKERLLCNESLSEG